MNESEPATDVSREIEAVSKATADLLAALHEADGVGMRRALERRGAAIERLRGPLMAMRRDGSARPSMLGDARQRLNREAEEAIAELQRVVSQVREAVDKIGREAAALRSYNDRSLPVALDRSG